MQGTYKMTTTAYSDGGKKGQEALIFCTRGEKMYISNIKANINKFCSKRAPNISQPFKVKASRTFV